MATRGGGVVLVSLGSHCGNVGYLRVGTFLGIRVQGLQRFWLQGLLWEFRMGHGDKEMGVIRGRRAMSEAVLEVLVGFWAAGKAGKILPFLTVMFSSG